MGSLLFLHCDKILERTFGFIIKYLELHLSLEKYRT